MRLIRLNDAHSFLLSSRSPSYFSLVLLLVFPGVDAHEHIVSNSSLGGCALTLCEAGTSRHVCPVLVPLPPTL